ncbi:unnamed protein product [Rotaria magnacalcarata]|uniref:Uncharacterized protein n=1 Tax=Rotaria magnacalcarata TaxID=392030 RepID=A0A816RES3_9BILA|nr:unnamed protein product [Rotaria magnacalcarata]CAF2142707.1 unnamed protein product [Rotaria magnacalcarata]CAF4183757.1 unnamed protein product [Rotaria magnacalcarata]CAF4215071.1 unnamed protein product [Rotaria magnacalcarata]
MGSSEHSIQIEKDFQKFSARTYLEEYYSEIQNEDKHHLRCLAKVYGDVKDGSTLLEFGGGPTLYQLMSAAPKVKEIHFSDYLEVNLAEVRNWVNRCSSAFNWNKITETALEAEGITATPEAINAREELLRGKITKFLHCDAHRKYPLGINDNDDAVQYDIVNCHFVAESISDTFHDWKSAFENICRCVKPGGKLVMAAMKRAIAWKNGDKKFLAVGITEQDVTNVLAENGFVNENIFMETFPADQEDYREVIFFCSNGSFNQLQKLYIVICGTGDLPSTDHAKIKISNMKCFPITYKKQLLSFDDNLVPLLHRMTNLEELHVHLLKFILNNQYHLPSNEDIKYSFKTFQNDETISSIDYFERAKLLYCHVYSYPYTWKFYHYITNNFHGGLFKSVREITLYDEHPFEHDFVFFVLLNRFHVLTN